MIFLSIVGARFIAPFLDGRNELRPYNNAFWPVANGQWPVASTSGQ
jgi:hypothetical protein